VRPPLEPLGRLLAHSYQLLAQLTAVKTMLLLRRGRLNAEQIRTPLQQEAQTIKTILSTVPVGHASTASVDADVDASAGPVALPDPFEHDLSPWLLRRLSLATGLARHVRSDAQQVLQPVNS
jgi:hypothetical protein